MWSRSGKITDDFERSFYRQIFGIFFIALYTTGHYATTDTTATRSAASNAVIIAARDNIFSIDSIAT